MRPDSVLSPGRWWCMATTTKDRPAGEQTELRRVIGPKLLLLFIVGDILGTGVYALTVRSRRRWAEQRGSPSSSRSRWRS